MKKWHIIVIAALSLVAIAAIVLAVLAQSSATTKSGELATAQAMSSQTVSSLNIAQSTADAGLATASAAQTRLSTQTADLSSQLSAVRSKVTSLEAAVNCESVPTSIDYSGNAAASNSLKTWLEDTQGKIDKVSWDAVWTNSKTSIHKLTGEFLFEFVVYFDEPKLNFKKGVYDIGGSCWLDR